MQNKRNKILDQFVKDYSFLNDSSEKIAKKHTREVARFLRGRKITTIEGLDNYIYTHFTNIPLRAGVVATMLAYTYKPGQDVYASSHGCNYSMRGLIAAFYRSTKTYQDATHELISWFTTEGAEDFIETYGQDCIRRPTSAELACLNAYDLVCDLIGDLNK